MTDSTNETSYSAVVDVLGRRLPVSVGGNPLNFLELFGATLVEMSEYDPDPRTFRGEYYYNTVLNRLYRRVVTHRRADGLIKAQWIGCGD